MSLDPWSSRATSVACVGKTEERCCDSATTSDSASAGVRAGRRAADHSVGRHALVRLVFAGTPAVALPALEAVVASRHDLVGVVTRPDAPAGRGRRLTASPVGRRGEELGVPVLKPAHPRDPASRTTLRALAPDCCPVVAYGALIPRSALDIPEHGWVNLHFSVLPAWRGAAPVQHALWAGDEVTGATTFRIVEALDAGPTFGLMTQLVRARRHRRHPARHPRRGRRRPAGGDPRRHRRRIAGGPRAARGGPQPGPEDHRRRRPRRLARARRRRRPPGPGLHARPRRVVDVRRGADQGRTGAHRPRPRAARARACSPWPRTPCTSAPPPHAVRLGEVQAFGKKRMPAADWARGVDVAPGARLE